MLNNLAWVRPSAARRSRTRPSAVLLRYPQVIVFPLPTALFVGRGGAEAAGEGSSGPRPGSFADFANGPVISNQTVRLILRNHNII